MISFKVLINIIAERHYVLSASHHSNPSIYPISHLENDYA